MDISFYCFLWRLISVRRVRASNGRQNRFLYRSHRNGQSRKNIVFMRLCGVSGIHFLRRGEQIILLFFISGYEVEVPILINRHFQSVFPPVGLSAEGELYHKERFFDYDTIFTDDYTLYDFSNVMPAAAAHLRDAAYRIIDLLDLSGYMRIDFRVREDGEYFVIDINNDPCINSCGSFFKSLELLGIDPKDIAGILIGNKIL